MSTTLDIRGTAKQQELMRIIFEAADAGEFLSIREIHSRLVSYSCAYGSVRCSMRFLVAAGILVRVKEGNRSMMKPTEKAYTEFRRRI